MNRVLFTAALVGAGMIGGIACTPEEIRAAIAKVEAGDASRDPATDPVCSSPFVACAVRPIAVHQDVARYGGDAGAFTLDGCVLGYKNRNGDPTSLTVQYGPTQYLALGLSVDAGATVQIEVPVGQRTQAYVNGGQVVEVHAAGC